MSLPLRKTQAAIPVLLAILISAQPSQAQPGGRVTLATHGQPSAVIVLPDPDRNDPDRLTPLMVDQSGKVLSEFLKRMTGADFRTVRRGELGEVTVEGDRLSASKVPSGSYILLGESDLTKRLHTTPALEPGSPYVKAAGNVLTILGPVDGVAYTGGVRYGVQQFLENQGVAYLWPGELGLVVPHKTEIAVPYGVETFTPPIKQRNIRMILGGARVMEGAKYLGIDDGYDKKVLEAGTLKVPYVLRSLGGWLEWQRVSGTLGIVGGHSLGDLWDRFGKTHPGWFALQPNGSRQQHNSERAQVCMSNSELVQQVADDIIAKADKDPNLLSAPLSLNDGGADAFCMCNVNALGEPGCTSYDPPNAPKIDLWGWNKPYVSLTDRYITFCNRVAEKVAAKYPKLLMVVDAYSSYSTPPVKTKLHPNLVVRYVPSGMDDWDAWSAKASKIYWRPNSLGTGYRVSELKFNRDFGENLNFAAHHSTVAVDFDSIINSWATEGLNYYVVARLSWNPDLKQDEIIDEYCRAGFGPAAPEMKQYFQRLDETSQKMYAKLAELYTGDPEKVAIHARVDSMVMFWTPRQCGEMRQLLDAAARKTSGPAEGNELIRKRIDFLRLGLDWTEMQSKAYAVLIAFKRQQPVDMKAAARLLNERRAMQLRIFKEAPLAINMAMVSWGDRGYWQPLLAAIEKDSKTKPATEGNTAIEADDEGRPITVPKF